ncbi:hypothetical protein E4U59_005677 [Claviceps monticola]|nr:hypothetical protein E4U59_005677 [Claviceps monticola]
MDVLLRRGNHRPSSATLSMHPDSHVPYKNESFLNDGRKTAVPCGRSDTLCVLMPVSSISARPPLPPGSITSLGQPPDRDSPGGLRQKDVRLGIRHVHLPADLERVETVNAEDVSRTRPPLGRTKLSANIIAGHLTRFRRVVLMHWINGRVYGKYNNLIKK